MRHLHLHSAVSVRRLWLKLFAVAADAAAVPASVISAAAVVFAIVTDVTAKYHICRWKKYICCHSFVPQLHLGDPQGQHPLVPRVRTEPERNGQDQEEGGGQGSDVHRQGKRRRKCRELQRQRCSTAARRVLQQIFRHYHVIEIWFL